MKVYFVRHGESKFYATKQHQNEGVPLSPQGEKQAHFVAKRFTKTPIDVILSSHYTRAKQTAEIISKETHVPIAFDENLRELKWPTEIEGKSYDSQISIKVREEIKKHFTNASWHYSDEENFFDLQTRAFSFLNHLNSRTEKNILVVSHGKIIRCIILAMMFGKDMDPDIFRDFFEFFSLKNTGITMCEKTENDKWHLLTWNDHAHLG